MNEKLAYILFAFAFIVAVVVGFESGEDLKPGAAEFRAKFNETVIQPLNPRNPAQVNPEPAPHSSMATKRAERAIASAGSLSRDEQRPALTREAFEIKYGEKLSLTQYENRVVRIDGSMISAEALDSSQKVSGFRPGDSSEVSARANEIFEDARALLGISGGQEFVENPPAVGESSAQAIFQQSVNNVPVYPGGLITILLGREGELRGLDSSVYPKTEILNTARLSPPNDARKILFVTQSAPVAQLRYAYETRVRGIQKVVDAETGVILFERDRRVR
jgi:hypothetical protein